MKILDGQEFGFTRLYPADIIQPLTFWTVAIAAGVIAIALNSTAIAFFNMAAEYGGATVTDRVEDTLIQGSQWVIIAVVITVFANDISDFIRGPFNISHILTPLRKFRYFQFNLIGY